ncbi:hypothetical protein M501DRAFT_995447 [Patellaria atrata CBS 101060]|uniref:Uncharacterized protein n=1 Tax=Patellaria atrata CBS 101060 TaxID=1346257 RepID=A0A9P4VQ74_9PEZI|nr:hypothetical protein M501DRAFT_995447 [Patellaria atrata CBS 101060]
MPSPTPVRAFFRSARMYLKEPHPYGRYPTTTPIHSFRTRDVANHLGRSATMFVPCITLFLGWPLLAKAYLNGKVGTI